MLAGTWVEVHPEEFDRLSNAERAKYIEALLQSLLGQLVDVPGVLFGLTERPEPIPPAFSFFDLLRQLSDLSDSRIKVEVVEIVQCELHVGCGLPSIHEVAHHLHDGHYQETDHELGSQSLKRST